MKSLRGRLLVEIIPNTHERDSGLIVVDRKEVSDKGLVLDVGSESMSTKGKKIDPPCEAGDIVYFKKFKPMFHRCDQEGMKKGIATVWWSDCLLIIKNPSKKERDNE